MKAFLRLVRVLSLDVVLGALASGVLVLFLLDSKMPMIWWLALPVSVWVIYSADHLLDAYRLGDRAHTDRHLFHHRYFFPLGLVWLFLLLLCAVVMPFFMPQRLIFFGFGMGGLVLLHLFLVWVIGGTTSRLLQKELGVGLIYCLGIWGGPFVYHQSWPTQVEALCFVQFLSLALMNLLIFSRYEANTDALDGHTSFARAIGEKNVIGMIRILMLLILSILVLLLLARTSTRLIGAEGVILAMGAVLLWINEAPKRFHLEDSYRKWGDGVFLFPFLLLIFWL